MEKTSGRICHTSCDSKNLMDGKLKKLPLERKKRGENLVSSLARSWRGGIQINLINVKYVKQGRAECRGSMSYARRDHSLATPGHFYLVCRGRESFTNLGIHRGVCRYEERRRTSFYITCFTWSFMQDLFQKLFSQICSFRILLTFTGNIITFNYK